ncbi:hypothetical protein, partial [Caballeronia sp.]|uniref:hypothetical protein n=1 Tax=Caballeronia sp. TaxID=1931223 RepID=UPI003C5FD9EC
IVLPYRGHAAAAREIARRVPELSVGSARARGGASVTPAGKRSMPIDFRLTVRTQMVLTAVAELSARELAPGGRGSAPSNREIADAAGVSDQGQISKLLRRLERLGLLENTGGQTQGIPNAWRLTDKGMQLTQTFRAHAHNNREVAS